MVKGSIGDAPEGVSCMIFDQTLAKVGSKKREDTPKRMSWFDFWLVPLPKQGPEEEKKEDSKQWVRRNGGDFY